VIKIYSRIILAMREKEYIGYCFGLVITILLIVAIFSFNYNSSVEKEYFENFLALEEEINNLVS
jgi:nicotinamide riboside transporter PnuC